MKKKVSKVLGVILSVLIIFSVLPLTTFAATDDFYTYEVSDGKATITAANESISGDITIPSTLGGYPVIGIGASAFYNCKALTGVILPEGVEYIEDEAFSCSGIKSLVIPSSISEIGAGICYDSYLKEITVAEENPCYCSDEYGVLYNKEKTELIVYPALSSNTVYTIPDGVKTICTKSFALQYTLKELIMPDSVEAIEEEVFFGCSALAKIRLSENLRSIGNYNFYFCFNLKELSLPSALKIVGDESFIELYSLEKIKIYSKDADLDNSLLGFLSQGKSVEDHREIASIYYDYHYTYYCLDDKNKAYEIAEQLYNYEGSDDPFANTYPIYCYRGSTAEEYAKAHNLEYFYMCEKHIPEVIEAVEATCLNSGFSEGTKCSVCSEILVAPEEIPAKGHTLSEWENDYDNNISTRSCENCDYTQSKELEEQGNGDVEIIAPVDPDLNFDIDSVEKNNKTFLLVEQSIKENTTVETEVLKVFDISLKNNDGVNVQPNGTVKVKLPLDWADEKNYKVYRVNDDGTLTNMNAFREGSHIVFETDHFSIYVIVEEAVTDNEDTTDKEEQSSKKDVFGFLIKLIKVLAEFFIKILNFLGIGV